MPSYEPVDLSAVCNAGVDVLGDAPGDVPLGRVDLRGLPFLIGPEPPAAERCLLLPGAPTSVGIGRRAHRVIVAHRLLEPGAPACHAVGQTVAEYAFHLAGVFDGVSSPVYAKTGTADVSGQGQPNSWMVAFDPTLNVAVGCLVLNAGYGASVAGPDVAAVLQLVTQSGS
jgi:hypothetical protein